MNFYFSRRCNDVKKNSHRGTEAQKLNEYIFGLAIQKAFLLTKYAGQAVGDKYQILGRKIKYIYREIDSSRLGGTGMTISKKRKSRASGIKFYKDHPGAYSFCRNALA
jgi:hypothetical protein